MPKLGFSSPTLSIWDAAHNPMLLLSVDGRVHHCNPAALDYFPNIIGSNFLDRVAARYPLQEQIEQTAAENTVTTIKHVAIEIDGKPTPFTARLAHFSSKDDSQAPRLIISLQPLADGLDEIEKTVRSHDERVDRLSRELISVSQQLLDKTMQLAEQKEKLSVIINGMADGLIGCDRQGHIIHCNQTAARLLQLPKEPVAGQPFAQLLPDLTEWLHMDPSGITPIPEQVRQIQRGEHALRIRTTNLRSSEGHPIGFLLLIQDLTREAEVERMKSDLISIITHELRSPLTSIKGYIELLASGELGEGPPHFNEYFDIISFNAERLSQLIDDMLDLSRIESGQLSMNFGKVDVKYLCDHVYLSHKPQAQKKQQQLTYQAEPGIIVSGDVDRLIQSLCNLVTNAVKYTPQGGKIHISAYASKDEITIAVQDTGIGISPEDQQKLFQKFFRVKNQATQHIGGTGLGLCIAKLIVEAHGGRIQVQSQPHQGSSFSIHLPQFYE